MTIHEQVLPTFIIAGAPHAGTTIVYRWLARHPHIWLAKPPSPEPDFFLDDDAYRRGTAYYSQLFTPGARLPARGEKSSKYLESPIAARRIFDLLDDVKLVFVLRNPIDRAYANYEWSAHMGFETLTFSQALALEAERESDYHGRWQYMRPFSYVSRGMYATLLGPYWQLFGPAKIHVVLRDDLERRPREATAAIFDFLGVAPNIESIRYPRHHRSETKSHALTSDELAFLARVFEEPNRELADLLGRDLECWNTSSVGLIQRD